MLDHIVRQGFPVRKDEILPADEEAVLLLQADAVLDDPFIRLKDPNDARARGITLPPCAKAAAGIVLVSQPGKVLKGQKAVQRGKSKRRPDRPEKWAEGQIFQQLLRNMTRWEFGPATRAA